MELMRAQADEDEEEGRPEQLRHGAQACMMHEAQSLLLFQNRLCMHASIQSSVTVSIMRTCMARRLTRLARIIDAKTLLMARRLQELQGCSCMSGEASSVSLHEASSTHNISRRLTC